MYSIMTYQIVRNGSGIYQRSVGVRATSFPGMDEFVYNAHLPDPSPTIVVVIDAEPPWLDFMLVENVVGGTLCSERFLKVLERIGAQFHAYPVQASSANGQHSKMPYYLWGPQQIPDAIDWDHCETWQNPDSGQRYITTLALTPAVLGQAIPVFRPSEIVACLVAESARARIEETSSTGMEFLPLDVIGDLATGRERAWLESRLKNDPENAELWQQLSRVYWRLHHLHAAQEAVNQALRLQPNFADAWVIKGLALREEGALVEARKAFEESLRHGSTDGPWEAYIALLRESGDFEDALVVAEQALSTYPQAPRIWYELGETQLALGNYEQALAALNHALLPKPGRDEIWYRAQGDTLAKLGRYEEAAAAYRRGLEFYPTIDLLWSHLSQSLRALNQRSQADEADEMALEYAQEKEENARRRPL